LPNTSLCARARARLGQFGSLYNSIRNTNNDHTAWAAVNVLASETITGYGQIVLTKSAASFRGPALDSTKVSAIPPGFDYAAISDLGRYSSLDMRWWNLEAGVHHTLRKQFLIDYALTYQDYKDNQPYLVNTTGKSLGFLLRANWIF
jgi:hypothetical protein